MSEVSVLGLGTGLPRHRVTAAEAKALARKVFANDFRDIDRMLRVFDSVHVQTRHIAREVAYYQDVQPFAEKNRVFAEVVHEIGAEAGRQAVKDAGVDPREIRGLVFVSSTGVLAPSPDARLVSALGLRPDVLRVPVWGLGCAGGGGGLGRAAVLARGLGGPVLLVCAEVCSATFVHEDRTRANLISTALFGDGASAAVVGEGASGGRAVPRVLATFSRLFADTEDVMGWDVVNGGLKVRFASSIPKIVKDEVAGVVAAAADAAGVAVEDVAHYVMHPGGPKVLRAYEEALCLGEAALKDAWGVLGELGNMSSPTVLFVLQRFLQRVPPAGAVVVLMGLGPGFCAEGVVLRW